VVGLCRGVEDRSGWEECSGDGEALWRRRTGAADGHRGVKTHGLVQDALEQGDGVKVRNDELIWQRLAVKGRDLFEESLSEGGVTGEMVEY
jgi:hypothetical protein